MKIIKLNHKQEAIVDDEDFDMVNQYKWYAKYSSFTKTYYACRDIKTIYMHRLILGLTKGDKVQVDHINKNTLDNRKSNLRIIDKRGNAENQRNQSKYGPGIQKRKDCKSKPFQAQAKINGKNKTIGMFATAEEAQQARQDYIRRMTT